MAESEEIVSIQILTSLPNANDKHIDYVICYEVVDKTDISSSDLKARERREQFFQQLKQESFEIYNIEQVKDGRTFMFCLLHCPVKRLMKEAEYLRLEMRLKNCAYQDKDNEEIQCGLLKKLRTLVRGQLKQVNDNTLSAQFEESISFMFEGMDGKRGPFNNTTRMLLVDNILKNLTFTTDRIRVRFNYDDCIREIVLKNLNSDRFENSSSIFDFEHYSESKALYRGLPYMLDKNYFQDAFILHEETAHHMYLKYLTKRRKNVLIMSFPMIQKVLKLFRDSEITDYRQMLYEKWASFKNTFTYQPLWEVRDYFGESNAIYFAWLGVLISFLWFPSLLGFIFFIVGMSSKSDFPESNHSIYYPKHNATFFVSNFYSNIFTNSFDNQLMPYFAMIICLWGAVFSECWKRENNRLSFEWCVQNYENHENDLPEYLARKKFIAKEKNPYKRLIWNYEKYWKTAVSTLILLIMILIVAFDLALSAAFRIYIKIRVFPHNLTLKFLFADVGSIFINTFLMMLLNNVYKKMAKKLTNWENHRTRTEHQDSLIFKCFAFDFVNSYGPVFYLTYFRNIDYDNGILNLGPDFQDKCEANNCMPLLTTQILIVLILKPLPRLIISVIYPLFSSFYHARAQKRALKDTIEPQQECNGAEGESREKLNERAVLMYLNIERSKTRFNDTITDEFNEKVILYGYVIIFSASFSLAPFLVLIINLVDLRVDAKRLLWLYRRPVGHKAQDIGSWFDVCRFLNVVGIVNNGFMVVFASNWSKIYLDQSDSQKLTFLIAFEYLAFFLWTLIIFLLPDTPHDVQKKMRQEAKFVKQIISAAKTIKKETVPGNFRENFNSANIEKRSDSYQNSIVIDEKKPKLKRKLTKIIPL